MSDFSSTTEYSNEMPLISVVVPVYQVEDYIDKCILSLIQQTYTNIEIALVDDGSKDKSGDICDAYADTDQRITVYHKKNEGLSAARNFGIDHTNGQFITFVDSDDYVDSDYVSYLYFLIRKYTTKMSICQHRVRYEDGKVSDLSKGTGSACLSTKKCLEEMLYHGEVDTSAWAKLYDRTLFANVRYPEGKNFEDIGTTYALIMQCDLIAVGYESKYNYISRSDSIVSGQFNPSKFDLLEMTDKMGRAVVHKYPDLKLAVQRRRVYARFSTLNQMLYTDGYEREKQSMIRFIKKNEGVILHDKNAPGRDKIAILLLNCGFGVYKFAWSIYSKIFK